MPFAFAFLIVSRFSLPSQTGRVLRNSCEWEKGLEGIVVSHSAPGAGGVFSGEAAAAHQRLRRWIHHQPRPSDPNLGLFHHDFPAHSARLFLLGRRAREYIYPLPRPPPNPPPPLAAKTGPHPEGPPGLESAPPGGSTHDSLTSSTQRWVREASRAMATGSQRMRSNSTRTTRSSSRRR